HFHKQSISSDFSINIHEEIEPELFDLVDPSLDPSSGYLTRDLSQPVSYVGVRDRARFRPFRQREGVADERFKYRDSIFESVLILRVVKLLARREDRRQAAFEHRWPEHIQEHIASLSEPCEIEG